MRGPTAFLTASLLVLTCLGGPLLGQSALEKSFRFVSIDKAGNLVNDAEWKAVHASIKAKKPTHVFLMSHGWNNTAKTAAATYARMVELMVEQRDENKLALKNFEPLVLGIHWISQWPDNEEDLEKSADWLGKGIRKLDPKADTRIKTALEKGLKHPLYGRLLNAAIPDTTFLEEAELDNATLEKAIKAASYYHMRARAKKVGEIGARQALEELQAACPDASFHLTGHSFGCKVMLGCVAEAKLTKPISTLVLLQGAVSSRCFAEKLKEIDDMPGAYAKIPGRVDGPIVATFTRKDKACSKAYPHASQVAGHFADLPVKKYALLPSMYAALGAEEIPGIKARPMLKTGSSYNFGKGLICVNADDFIAGHSEIKNAEVAWMIWAAVLRK